MARHILKDHITFDYFETLDTLELFDLVEFSYKRDNKNYYIKPCICEILKLNVFDNVIKLRKVNDGESFDSAKIIYSGFIQKPEYNYLDTVTITAGDIRYTFSNTLTSKVFSVAYYPHLEKFP